MKALKMIIAGMMMFLAGQLPAQFNMSFTIGVPPPWGPIGYTSVRYYYLPDVEAYYDVRSSMFIYYGGGAWVHKASLPPRYKGYDLYHGYKVVMPDYRGNTPYTHFKEHKMKYGRGYRGKPQRTIGEKSWNGHPAENKFYRSPDGNHGRDHNQGKSQGHGHDKNSKGNHGHDGGNDKKK